ncbi:MAG: carboxypeptidase-like regulatory domain-containing protein, partial [Candidatus Omnitrophota bacterium]
MSGKGKLLYAFVFIGLMIHHFLLWGQPQTPENTVIYGRVLDAKSGQPIAGAQISASGHTVKSDKD